MTISLIALDYQHARRSSKLISLVSNLLETFNGLDSDSEMLDATVAFVEKVTQLYDSPTQLIVDDTVFAALVERARIELLSDPNAN